MKCYRAGIDVGSTTVKMAVLDEKDSLVFERYCRHHAHTQETLADILKEVRKALGSCCLQCAITGSGGIRMSRSNLEAKTRKSSILPTGWKNA